MSTTKSSKASRKRDALSGTLGKAGSLDGAILRAFESAPAKKVAGASKRGAALGRSARAELTKKSRELREQLGKFGLLRTETVRFRPAGLADRRLIIEYASDPEDSRAVLMRITQASDLQLPDAPPKMLTTQQAADAMSVSRPYVVDLVDRGVFKGVEHTQSGHRRIPVAEVERVRQEMSVNRRKSLEALDDLTADLRARELDTAHKKSKSRWVRKSA
jgi:excisionase family DNA binding protein